MSIVSVSLCAFPPHLFFNSDFKSHFSTPDFKSRFSSRVSSRKKDSLGTLAGFPLLQLLQRGTPPGDLDVFRQENRQFGRFNLKKKVEPGSVPQLPQWISGMGAPQYRWREINQSWSLQVEISSRDLNVEWEIPTLFCRSKSTTPPGNFREISHLWPSRTKSR